MTTDLRTGRVWIHESCGIKARRDLETRRRVFGARHRKSADQKLSAYYKPSDIEDLEEEFHGEDYVHPVLELTLKKQKQPQNLS
jgi:hypothetical protein